MRMIDAGGNASGNAGGICGNQKTASSTDGRTDLRRTVLTFEMNQAFRIAQGGSE